MGGPERIVGRAMRRNTARARPWGSPDCPVGFGPPSVCVRINVSSVFPPVVFTSAAHPNVDLNGRAPVIPLAQALEQCIKSDGRVRRPMDFRAKLDKGRTLADVYELVKRDV